MASTYVNDLRLNEMATGDGSGTWGTTTNTNLELIAEAFSYGTEVITTNADTHTTTIADGATDPGRSMYLKYTGTLDSACTITIGPNTVSKVWIIENGTSGSQDIILSQGSGANITIPAGDTKVVYSDGAGAGAAFVDAFASLSVVDLKVQDDLTVTGDIDVDGTTNLDVVDIDGALTQDGGAVFNETGADVDFRVESDTVDHALFVQGSDGNVGIGTSSPSYILDVTGASANVAKFKRSSVGTTEVLIDTAGSGDAQLVFADNGTDSYAIGRDNTNGDFVIAASGALGTSNLINIESGGNVGIGTSSPDAPLAVQAAVNTTAMRLGDDGASTRDLIVRSFAEAGYNGAGWDFDAAGQSAAGTLTFSTNSTERVRIDSSGNLLVGGTTTTTIPTLNKGIYLVSSTNGDVIGYSLYANEGTNNRRASFFLDDTNGVYGFDTTASSGVCDFVVNSAATERMRIDSSGNLFVGATALTANANFFGTSPGNAFSDFGHVTGVTSGVSYTRFLYAGSVIGSIAQSGTTAVLYNTTSDQRLKENIADADDAGSKIDAIQVRQYDWKADGSHQDYGMIAQELQTVAPEAVSGDADSEEMMGVDYSKLVPMLVKEIQSLRTRITALES
jgi:hypothetical protein